MKRPNPVRELERRTAAGEIAPIPAAGRWNGDRARRAALALLRLRSRTSESGPVPRMLAEVRRIFDEAYTKCEQILNEHRELHVKIAEYLLEHETLEGEDFAYFCEHGEPPVKPDPDIEPPARVIRRMDEPAVSEPAPEAAEPEPEADTPAAPPPASPGDRFTPEE